MAFTHTRLKSRSMSGWVFELCSYVSATRGLVYHDAAEYWCRIAEPLIGVTYPGFSSSRISNPVKTFSRSGSAGTLIVYLDAAECWCNIALYLLLQSWAVNAYLIFGVFQFTEPQPWQTCRPNRLAKPACVRVPGNPDVCIVPQLTYVTTCTVNQNQINFKNWNQTIKVLALAKSVTWSHGFVQNFTTENPPLTSFTITAAVAVGQRQ